MLLATPLSTRDPPHYIINYINVVCVVGLYGRLGEMPRSLQGDLEMYWHLALSKVIGIVIHESTWLSFSNLMIKNRFYEDSVSLPEKSCWSKCSVTTHIVWWYSLFFHSKGRESRILTQNRWLVLKYCYVWGKLRELIKM